MKTPFKHKKIIAFFRDLNHARIENRRAKQITGGSGVRSTSRKRRDAYHINKQSFVDDQPLVSIVIVGFNGAHHLISLTESLRRQTYRHFEVIYVDNASSDDSASVMRQLMPDARIIENNTNSGFAEGNNIGTDHAAGNLILLLNNDAKLDDVALEHMVRTMRSSEKIGAVAPKIRFWEPFFEICIAHSNDAPKLTLKVTDSSTGYRKSITKTSGTKSFTSFLIPESTQKIEVFKVSEEPPYAEPEKVTKWQGTVDNTRVNADAPLSIGATQWVINNAGSWISAVGDAGDWGIGELDEGQYDTPCKVDAFCGCCVLLRAPALGLKPLFPPNYFAYFEDTDASERIRRAGFDIVYQPDAVVYHKHASTSVEDSEFFKYFTKRNNLLFQATHFPQRFNKQSKKHFDQWARQGILSHATADLIDNSPYASKRTLLEDTLALATQAMNGAIYQRHFTRKRIGIFNEYWTSMGGGELRALHIALEMRQYGDVYLISRIPINISQICAHFGLSEVGLRLAIVPEFKDIDTADLDIFINTAFSSTIHPRAKRSAYIVSFPHTHGHFSDITSYDVLLTNSIFTQNWCLNYWPTAKAEILYPAVKIEESEPQLEHKERIIVSVGRFFPSGHSKRQAEMVEAFRELVTNGCANWRLVLIGGCNLTKEQDLAYLTHVKKLAEGLPIEILDNASSKTVESYLKKASIYWHATGVGLTSYAPSEFEHFGMAIVEAMSHCAVPIIHNRGGAPEIVEDNKSGLHFDTIHSLIQQTQKLVELQNHNISEFKTMARAARERSLSFSLEVHNRNLHQIARKYLL